MIAIGVGCRRGCPANDIASLVAEALADLPSPVRPSGLFSIAEKRDETGLREAADLLGLPLIFLEKAALEAVAGGAQTRSARVMALLDLPSVAETAALAGAGTDAVLLVRRKASRRATCAIAGPPPSSSDDGQT